MAIDGFEFQYIYGQLKAERFEKISELQVNNTYINSNEQIASPSHTHMF